MIHAKPIAVIIGLAMLSGCSLFDSSDPRERDESVEACAKRMAGWDAIAEIGRVDKTGYFTPTYTFDITKLGLEEMQALTVDGGDETAGSRTMASTNETSTAVDQFMQQPVDEKGAFFLGRDPALFRVRGETLAFDQILTAGCERQQPGKQLIDIALEPAAPTIEEADAATENENDI
ncbi:hypothetical protein [Erythrobacter rubeus]|uniref:Lipoprotein n=1 Tax=Erythrobacter rubeus TaxID=2760803 RepID=A0ABR8KPW2_9SPHN|nr:hypothetical protein [Erythrobacter rubeus]MBD2841919.1 hypothetical protein [Erythrobacter rubeus]